MLLKPRQKTPNLRVPLIQGSEWSLEEQKPEHFTVVVFYRGVHCPLCKEYITELDSLVSEFHTVGATSVVAVSGDDIGRARKAISEWDIKHVPIGYSQSLASMREWGLYVSKAIREGQPNEFGEPAMFIIRPDQTLYAAIQTTMPFMRPNLKEAIETIKWVIENNYPARGEILTLEE